MAFRPKISIRGSHDRLGSAARGRGWVRPRFEPSLAGEPPSSLG
jgi:hypothetical protein